MEAPPPFFLFPDWEGSSLLLLPPPNEGQVISPLRRNRQGREVSSFYTRQWSYGPPLFFFLSPRANPHTFWRSGRSRKGESKLFPTQ